MTEKEFTSLAKKLGYNEDEISELVQFQKETGMPFEKMPLLQRDIN